MEVSPSSMVEAPAEISHAPETLLAAVLQPPEKPPQTERALEKYDVVQVIDTTSRHYGVFFTVGDKAHRKVHGYMLVEGGKKEFLTISEDFVWWVGTAKVRAAKCCSDKWLSDNRS